MRNWGWLAVLGGCSLVACGGSARATRDQGAGAGGAGAGGAGAGAGGAGAGAGGAGAGGDAGAGSVHLGPGSWEVSGDINTLTTPAFTCGHFDFTMTVDDHETLTLGRNGEMHSAPVQILDGAYVARSVHLVGNSTSLPCVLSTNVVDELRLQGVDRDGDGEADELEGTVSFSFDTETASGKAQTETVISHLTATRDRTSPTLILPATTELNPLDFATILASEPLEPTTTLTLTGTSQVDLQQYESSNQPVPGATIAFSLLQILPLSGTWQLAGAGKDLAGHALDVSGVLSTLADPGVQAQDGFEGALSVGGGASLVAGFGSIPAIAGEHSLWLENGSRLLVHLQRADGQKTLHFAARYLGTRPDSAYETRFGRTGVVGGGHVVVVTAVGSSKLASVATGDTQIPWASDVVRFEATLDEPGQDVLLSIDGQTSCGTELDGTPCPPISAALMIDDLMLD